MFTACFCTWLDVWSMVMNPTPTPTPTNKDSDEQLAEALENLYYAGVEADSIEAVSASNNRAVALQRAKAALRAYTQRQSLQGRMDEVLLTRDSWHGTDDEEFADLMNSRYTTLTQQLNDITAGEG